MDDEKFLGECKNDVFSASQKILYLGGKREKRGKMSELGIENVQEKKLLPQYFRAQGAHRGLHLGKLGHG